MATTAPGEPAEHGEATVEVSIFYLTNRRRYEGKPAADTCSGDR